MNTVEVSGLHDNAHEPLIQTQGLRLGYGSRCVLDHLDLCIRVGESWFLLGPNGTGKTSLLKALLGILPPKGGKILIHPRLARRDRIGFVPQGLDLNPSLPTTVREFVRLGLVGIRVSRKEQAERLFWALEMVGLDGMAKTSYWSLSGGQRQRALVARTLVRRPILLIMDEPTNGLDLTAETALLDYVTKLNRDTGLTILCVSHNLATAARYGNHVVLFHEGTAEAGPAADMLTADSVERVFRVRLESAWETSVGLTNRDECSTRVP